MKTARDGIKILECRIVFARSIKHYSKTIGNLIETSKTDSLFLLLYGRQLITGGTFRFIHELIFNSAVELKMPI